MAVIGADGANDMSQCKYMQRMSALYDGEVSEEEGRELAEHVRGCSACAAELERLRSLSVFLQAAKVPELQSASLRRFHEAVSGAADRAVLKMARVFALAAALLLVASLAGMRQSAQGSGPYASTAPEWERAAVLRQTDLSIARSAEIQLAEWIVEDLSRENGSD
jgi:anti-sigma factor RsiW